MIPTSLIIAQRRAEEQMYALEASMRMVLEALKMPLGNPNFEGTPKRWARWMIEATSSWMVPDKALWELQKTAFPSSYDQLIVVKNIAAFGLCPHHLLPVEYTVHIGYIPNEETHMVVGLSKLPRFVCTLAKQPILQEEYTKMMADMLDTALAPMGTGVVVSGRHSCMRTRGVTQDTPVLTSEMRGALRDKPQARAEFFGLINL